MKKKPVSSEEKKYETAKRSLERDIAKHAAGEGGRDEAMKLYRRADKLDDLEWKARQPGDPPRANLRHAITAAEEKATSNRIEGRNVEIARLRAEHHAAQPQGYEKELELSRLRSERRGNPCSPVVAKNPLSYAEGKRQRRHLMTEIAKEQKRKDREALATLRQQIRDVKTKRKEAMRAAVVQCKAGRLAAVAKARARVLDLKAAAKAAIARAREDAKNAARSACVVRKQEIRDSSLSEAKRKKAELKAERQLQLELAGVDRRLAKRERSPRASAAERRGESDDEVRQNIPAELVPLFERVKRSIKGSPRESRTESFLHYAEEHPGEVVDAQEAISQREVARLIREEAALERSMRSPQRYRATPAELAAVPF